MQLQYGLQKVLHKGPQDHCYAVPCIYQHMYKLYVTKCQLQQH